MSTRVLSLIALVCLFTMGGCRKAIDYIYHHNPNETPCKLTHIKVLSQYLPYDINNNDDFLVTWDSAGRPVSIVNQTPAGVNEDYYFRYDSLGRLADYIPAISGTQNAVNWHKYAYMSDGTIQDSLLFFGGLANGPEPVMVNEYHVVGVHHLDAQARIIQSSWYNDRTDLSPYSTVSYSYDSHGNRVNASPNDTLTYDHKVNVYRQSKVFQFVWSDFSQNNPLSPTGSSLAAYNAYGLPTALPQMTAYKQFDMENANPTIVFEYACTVSGPHHY